MEKKKNKTITSVIVAIIGAVVLSLTVLFTHNSMLKNIQLNNNHEKLELIEDMIADSIEDEETITSVYDEQYQSKVDTMAFYLKNLEEPEYNNSLAEQLKNAFAVDYVSLIENGSVVGKAGDEIVDEGPRSYSAQAKDGITVTVQISDTSALEKNLHENASLYSVLKDIHVGQTGYAIAVHAEKETILYSPEEDEIGNLASDHGIDVSKLVDGEDTTITYDDVEYLASVKQVDNGLIVTMVPSSEINGKDTHTVIISLLVYIIFISIIIVYAHFLREDVQHAEEIDEAKKQLHKKFLSIVVVGTLFSFVGTYYMETLFRLSEQSITNNARNEELLETLETNETTISSQEDAYNEQYSQKLSEASYILSHVEKEKLTRTFMSELKDALKVNSVMYFDLNGKVIAANTDNWSYTISTNEEDQSYEFWDILSGEKTEIIQDVQENVNGNLRQYMAKAVQDGSYHTVGMVTMSATPDQLENALMNTNVENVLSGVSTGSKGFAFAVTVPTEEKNPTFVYFPKDNLIGKDALSHGMRENQFVTDYNDFIRIDGTSYYCTSRIYDDVITYIAIPVSTMNSTALPTAGITAAILFVCMLVLWKLNSDIEEGKKIYSNVQEGEAEQVDVVMTDGRTAKARSAGFRWTHDDISWQAKTAGQKTMDVVNFALTILAFIVMVFVVFADTFFREDSLLHFVLNGKWQKGINLFSITYCVIVMICVIEISVLVRKFVMWIAHSLNAKGETICRLIDNFLKFATMIGLLYFSLSTFGVDTSTLVTSAGILTLIVGLGAQSLVNDILSGLFIVFESEFQVGDIVTISGTSGKIVEIGIRTTKMSTDGNIQIFSNSDVKNILNQTKDYSPVFCDVMLLFDEDLLDVENMLRKELPEISKRLPKIVSGLKYAGVVSMPDPSTLTIRVSGKCLEADRGQLKLDLTRQMKLLFDSYREEKRKEKEERRKAEEERKAEEARKATEEAQKAAEELQKATEEAQKTVEEVQKTTEAEQSKEG